MNLKSSSIYCIAKNRILKETDKFEPLDKERWRDYIDSHNDIFIWAEHTADGIETLKNIDKHDDFFRPRILSSLNKARCHAEFIPKRDLYNITITHYEEYNYIRVQFLRKPKLKQIKILVEMAKHMDALFLLNDKKIIDENIYESLT